MLFSRREPEVVVQALGPWKRHTRQSPPGRLGFVAAGLLYLLTLALTFTFTFTFTPTPALAQACPDLSAYYPGADPDWPTLERRLAALMPACLESAEYFALLGAARLNNGRAGEALEALERAMLLEPDNGGAQIDYAEALFQLGQLFPALEMNARILARQDLPANLRPALEERQRTWRGLTRELSFQTDFLAGYDSNLNGAPDPSQITLTLSGESVLLPLNPDFRPRSGPYLNTRLASRYRQLAPGHQHNVSAELRGRISEHTQSDVLQFDTRYAFINPGSERSWQLTAGMSHLFFGGSALYSAAEAGGRYQWNLTDSRCRPFSALAAQHQTYHGQSRLNGVEARLSGGLSCPRQGSDSQQQTTLEVGLLSNEPLKGGRPGGGREGWQINLDWQRQWQQGFVRALLNHTRLDDRRGYSPLLVNGAAREVERSFALLQYRRPLNWAERDASLIVNFYHQRQRSNIELFRTIDTTIELGISLRF